MVGAWDSVQGFQGVDYSTKDRSSGPVQFEADPAEADPFGLDQMLSKVGRHSSHHFCLIRTESASFLLFFLVQCPGFELSGGTAYPFLQ